jgi:hypothetical protein
MRRYQVFSRISHWKLVTFLSHDIRPVDEVVSCNSWLSGWLAGTWDNGYCYLAGPLVVGRLTDTLAGDMLYRLFGQLAG